MVKTPSNAPKRPDPDGLGCGRAEAHESAMAPVAEEVSHNAGSTGTRARDAFRLRAATCCFARSAYSPSRRSVLKGVMVLLAVPSFWLMHSLTKREESIPEESEAVLSFPLPKGNGIRFFEKVIVVNSERGLAVFSSRCPHLGCRINQAEGNEIVCPCHGSRFSMNGGVQHGPATHGLQSLNYSVDQANAVVHVTVKK